MAFILRCIKRAMENFCACILVWEHQHPIGVRDLSSLVYHVMQWFSLLPVVPPRIHYESMWYLLIISLERSQRTTISTYDFAVAAAAVVVNTYISMWYFLFWFKKKVTKVNERRNKNELNEFNVYVIRRRAATMSKPMTIHSPSQIKPSQAAHTYTLHKETNKHTHTRTSKSVCNTKKIIKNSNNGTATNPQPSQPTNS